jgi:hypothetical protein
MTGTRVRRTRVSTQCSGSRRATGSTSSAISSSAKVSFHPISFPTVSLTFFIFLLPFYIRFFLSPIVSWAADSSLFSFYIMYFFSPPPAPVFVYRTVQNRGLRGVTKRCRLSWLTNSALVYEPKCGGKGKKSQPRSTAVHRSPNNHWKSDFIFSLCKPLLSISLFFNSVSDISMLSLAVSFPSVI